MSNPSAAAQAINSANTAQAGQALLIQGYANSVLEQPQVDFTGDPTLQAYQAQINTGLLKAQDHANNYLNTIQPSIIENISAIGNYYALNNTVPMSLPAGSTTAQWTDTLGILSAQATAYEADASNVLTSLQTLHASLSSDAADFATVVSELNAAVNGDNGVLASDDVQLKSIQGQIDGAIAGTVVSGLTIAGGAFMIVVGGIADFVTAGASTPLVLAGVGVVATGVGGEVASAVMLKSLLDQKASFLRAEASLKEEVKLALGLSSSYHSLSGQLSSAINAATAMKNAWNFLGSDLESFISDLNNGIQNADQVRTLFLAVANTEVQTVLSDISTIKAQMEGVAVIKAASGQTVGDALVAALNEAWQLKRLTLLNTSELTSRKVGYLSNIEQRISNN
ncbi:alpha-helical pore-forming toxin family protein [Acidicapsa ligni]|uniref:alpha-helical pore-forming toxin family protein n=1 Tax=Acidicapsa ligni TaxID=542300 RepID=UPI0021E0DC51|nr:alpha-helical pore-forming toxin family protein [Acidicapsa ligni]